MDMSHIPAWELALRGQGEGRRVGVGTVGLSELWCSLGGEWYPHGRIWDPPSGKGGLQSWCWEGIGTEERNGGEERMRMRTGMGSKIRMGTGMGIGKGWG